MLDTLKERKMALAILSWAGVAVVALLTALIIDVVTNELPYWKAQHQERIEQKAREEAQRLQEAEEARLAAEAAAAALAAEEEAARVVAEAARLAEEAKKYLAAEECQENYDKALELARKAAEIAGTKEYEDFYEEVEAAFRGWWDSDSYDPSWEEE